MSAPTGDAATGVTLVAIMTLVSWVQGWWLPFGISVALLVLVVLASIGGES
jgi:hypothetical protein